MILSIATYQISPTSDDLYNLVYGGDDPAKVENTLVFLSIFPTIQIGLAGGFMFLRAAGKIGTRKSLLILSGSLLFLAMNVRRCLDTWAAFT